MIDMNYLIKSFLAWSILLGLHACTTNDPYIANPSAGDPAYSEDVLIDEIEVFSDSAACARLVDQRIICSEYPAALGVRSLLRLTPSVACDEGVECRESVTSGGLHLLSSLGDGTFEPGGTTARACAAPLDGNGMICWGGASIRPPADMSYYGDECAEGACDVVCGEWQGESGCWGHWILRDHTVMDFDGACALFETGDILCPSFFGIESGVNELAQQLVDTYGPAIALRTMSNGLCVIGNNGQVKCAGGSENLPTQLSTGETYNELIGHQGSSALCARRVSDGKTECVGPHAFLTEDESNLCEDTPETCPAGKTDETLSSVKLSPKSICGLNDAGKMVCYFNADVVVNSDDDPFDYRDRINNEGLLLRELVHCQSNKCTSAETYVALSLNRGSTHSLVNMPLLIGCAITTKSRPHCFGMHTSGAPSCSWWNEDGCAGRVF